MLQFDFKLLDLESSKRQVKMSCSDNGDSALLDLEIVQSTRRKSTHYQAALLEAKMLQKEATKLLKEKRDRVIREGVNEFKDNKTLALHLLKASANRQLEEKREEVNKLREISKIIHTEQKHELDRNLQVFLSLNKEEKGLRKELVEKQHEVDLKEKYLKRMNVVQHHKQRKERAEEQTNFVNTFTQAKNLIEKQMKVGKAIKERKALIQDKKIVIE